MSDKFIFGIDAKMVLSREMASVSLSLVMFKPFYTRYMILVIDKFVSQPMLFQISEW